MSSLDLRSHFSGKSFPVICFVVICIATSTVLAQAPEGILFEGVKEYLAGNFRSCIDILHGVIDSPAMSPDQKIEAYAYIGASYYKLLDTLWAERTFEICIRLDTSYTLGMDFSLDIHRFYDNLKRKLLVSLTITTEPPGATLFIDGDSVGSTPFMKDPVFGGDLYDVLLTLEGYKEIRTQIKIEKGKHNLFHFEMERAFCPLNISCSPSDAVVRILDSKGLITPWTDSIPCKGKFLAKFSKKGYHDTTVSLECLAGETKNIPIKLIPERGPGDGPLKYWTSAWCGLALSSYIYFNSKAKSSHEKYMESIYIDDINRNWNDYENSITARNVSGGATGVLALWSGYLWSRYIWREVTHRSANLEDTFDDEEQVGIGFDARDGRVKVFLTKRF
jgi:hypothetical protein